MRILNISIKIIIIVIIHLLLFSYSSFAAKFIDDNEWSLYDTQEAKASAANNPKYDLTQTQIQQVNVGDMTAKTAERYMDKLSSEQKTQLNEMQLSHKSNLQKAGDLSKLNQNSMQNSVKNKFNIKMPKAGAGSLINMIGDKLKSLKTNFDGNGNLEINNPLSTTTNDKLIVVKGNSNSKTTYNVETDSKVSLELNDIEIAYIGDTLNEIIDFKHIDKSRESSIDIQKQTDGSYKITTSNLESTYHGNGFNEYVFGENSVIA